MERLDKAKPHGEIHGHCPVDGARYEQSGHYFDSEGRVLDPKRLSTAALELMEPDDVRNYLEMTFPEEKIDKRFGKERLLQWVTEHDLAKSH